MKYGKLVAKLFAQRSNNNAQVAVALIAGLAAGAVISILFAPASGEESRRRIAGKAKKLGEGIKEGYHTLKHKLGEEEHEELAAETVIPHLVKNVAPPKRKPSPKKRVVNIKGDISAS